MKQAKNTQITSPIGETYKLEQIAKTETKETRTITETLNEKRKKVFQKSFCPLEGYVETKNRSRQEKRCYFCPESLVYF